MGGREGLPLVRRSGWLGTEIPARDTGLPSGHRVSGKAGLEPEFREKKWKPKDGLSGRTWEKSFV